MDLSTFIVMLMFLWIINATITGALYYIYKDKKVLFLNLTIGYSILFLSYIFFYLRIEHETYIITLFANVLYFIGNLFIIKGLYKYANMKEKINFKFASIMTIVYIFLFTLMFSFGDFYYRNILNAFYPMIAYVVILIQQHSKEKPLYKRAVMIVLFVHIVASLYRIVVSIAASSSLDFYNLADFNVMVYAFGQLSLVFLGQFIVIGIFYLDRLRKLLLQGY